MIRFYHFTYNFLAYGQRFSMGADWDDILYDHLQKQHQINCCLRFKYKNKNIFAVASCRECYARFEFQTPDKNSDSENKIVIVVKKLKSPNEEMHNDVLKRKIKGSARLVLKQKLLLKKPLAVLDEMTLEKNTTKNPLVPSLNTLRKIRSENNNSRFKGCDEFTRLRILNHSIKNYGVIKYLLQEPYYINVFWTDGQEKLVKDSEVMIYSIDATGSVVNSPIFSESKQYEIIPQMQKPVFFYLITLNTPTKERSVPVNQMLSNSHSSETIQKWLTEFKVKSGKVPNEVRLDCSSALLSATTNTYNKCSLKDYVNLCYESIQKNKLLVTTIIRLDKSHVVKIFSRWKIWIISKCGRIIKYFYIKLLKQFISESNFNNLKNLCEHLVRVMIAKNENEEVIQSINVLNDYINRESDSDELINENCEDFEEESFLEKDDFNFDEESWIKSLYEKVAASTITVNSSKITKINPFYLPDFKNDFVRIMNLSPLWTNVMRNLANYQFDIVCTTSTLESKFNNIKNTIFHHQKLPTSSDVFMETYINHVKADVIRFDESSTSVATDIRDIPEKKQSKNLTHPLKSNTNFLIDLII